MSMTLDTPFCEFPERGFAITRMFDAPSERVFNAWLDGETLKQWSAPQGFTVTQGSAEHRPGGGWRCCMRSPDGIDLCVGGTYREIAPPERLVFTHAWDDDEGNPGHETLVTVNFADLGGKSVLTLQQSGFDSPESRDGHEGGWRECLGQLAELLARQ